MGLGVGGSILQKMYRDESKADRWGVERTTRFNIQITNTECFARATGLAPPDTPVTAKTYADHGHPYFELYNEPEALGAAMIGDFAGVKTVNQIDAASEQDDAQHVVDEVSESTNNWSVLLNA